VRPERLGSISTMNLAISFASTSVKVNFPIFSAKQPSLCRWGVESVMTGEVSVSP
jgi:hypothetical protein